MILELMQSRRSIRKFKPDIPDRVLIEELLAAAVTAPSASNKQPWRFLVVTNPAVKQRMADSVRDAVERVADRIEPQFKAAFRDYGDYFTRFESAPVVVAPLFRPLQVLSQMIGPGLSEADTRNIGIMENHSGLVSVSLAVQNLLLIAHEKGLGASGMTGPLIARDHLRAMLAVPTGWDLVALVALGYPDEQPPAPIRRSPAEITRWIV